MNGSCISLFHPIACRVCWAPGTFFGTKNDATDCVLEVYLVEWRILGPILERDAPGIGGGGENGWPLAAFIATIPCSQKMIPGWYS